MTAVKYLESIEWSMGSGQCPECCGVSKSWLGHPCYLTAKGIGHKKNCTLAKAIKDSGGDPLYIGEYKNNQVYEIFVADNGAYATRLKHNKKEAK